MISGISSEKPELDFVLYTDAIWSAYDVIGDMMRNTGATKPEKKEITAPILVMDAPAASRSVIIGAVEA